MAGIDSLSTIRIIRNSLSLIHPSIMEHGSWVAYALYKVLKSTGKYTKEQLDDFYLLGLFHDCGAYKTDDFEKLLDFDCQGVWSHSVYGYFYLKYLSPLSKNADIILYHHLDYRLFDGIQYPLKEISMYLAVIDRVDVMLRKKSYVFDVKELRPYRDKKFWGGAIDAFIEAERRYYLIAKNRNRSYLEEADSIIQDMDMPEETCREMLKFFTYMIDFRHEDTAMRTINTNIISVGICKILGLTQEEESNIYYASLLYDLGMLSVPRSILDAPRTLTPAETKRVHYHVKLMEKLLSGNISDEVIQIAACHHERLNGSGYPRGLKAGQIDRLSRILAVTDVLVALSTKHSYREPFMRKEIMEILATESETGNLCPEIVKTVIQNYDYLMDTTEEIKSRVLEKYWRIKDEFALIMKRFEKYNL